MLGWDQRAATSGCAGGAMPCQCDWSELAKSRGFSIIAMCPQLGWTVTVGSGRMRASAVTDETSSTRSSRHQSTSVGEWMRGRLSSS